MLVSGVVPGSSITVTLTAAHPCLSSVHQSSHSAGLHLGDQTVPAVEEKISAGPHISVGARMLPSCASAPVCPGLQLVGILLLAPLP